jgi:hypothetical protein
VTREQAIVLGFIAAAFVAGWIARALSGVRERDLPAEGDDQLTQIDMRFERALEETRKGFDHALRTYHAMVTSWLAGQERPGSAEATLEDEVSVALRDDAANETMLDGLGRESGGALTDRELDLTDWGFTYGVAWARARDRRAGEAGEVIAREALRAAEAVFDAYTAGADWTRPVEEQPAPQPEREPNGAANVLRPVSE